MSSRAKKDHRSSKSSGNNKKKRARGGGGGGRVRGRTEVGTGAMLSAVQNYDVEQELARLEGQRQETIAELARLHEQRQTAIAQLAASGALLPPPYHEELAVEHWKIHPDASTASDNKNQLLCNLDGGKWKIVVATEDLYDTFCLEAAKREWKDFAEYKRYMLDKYYVEEAILDCFVKAPPSAAAAAAEQKADSDNNKGGDDDATAAAAK